MEVPLSPETLAAQAMGAADPETGALVPPLHTATTYEMHPDGSLTDGRAYTRADNPTYDPAEQLINTLEGGAGCILFASGNAAATAVFQALLPGDHVLVSRILYWGIRKWLAEFAVTWGLDVEFVEVTDLEALSSAIRPGVTRLLWLETPANPTWEITDIAAAAEIAHAAQVCVAVDNTVPTPVLTRPLELGADLVVHSATKYLNGHSDVLAGAVVTARLDPLWERIRSWRRNAGAMLGPFEAWLLQRGMRTLFVRVRRASETALTLAQQLEGHPALKAVLYPGLPSHPGHEGGGATDARRLWRHAVDPGCRRRGTGVGRGRGGAGVQARHLARRRGESDRAPIEHRRPLLAGAGGSAAIIRWPGDAGGPVGGSDGRARRVHASPRRGAMRRQPQRQRRCPRSWRQYRAWWSAASRR